VCRDLAAELHPRLCDDGDAACRTVAVHVHARVDAAMRAVLDACRSVGLVVTQWRDGPHQFVCVVAHCMAEWVQHCLVLAVRVINNGDDVCDSCDGVVRHTIDEYGPLPTPL
jgi:hypothetical protein